MAGRRRSCCLEDGRCVGGFDGAVPADGWLVVFVKRGRAGAVVWTSQDVPEVAVKELGGRLAVLELEGCELFHEREIIGNGKVGFVRCNGEECCRVVDWLWDRLVTEEFEDGVVLIEWNVDEGFNEIVPENDERGGELVELDHGADGDVIVIRS